MAMLLTHRRWTLVALLGLSIAGSVSALGVISQNYFTLSQSSLRAKNTMLALSELEGSLKDAETGQRGFLLTGNSDYLEPYLIGSGIAQANIAKLNELITASDAASIKALEDIEYFTKLKLEELKQTVELRRTDGLGAALPIVQSNAGKAYMDLIRQRSNRIRFAQETTLGTNSVILTQLDNYRNSTILFIGLASSGIFWLLLTTFREELRLRKEITTSQQGELQVKEEAVRRLKEAADVKERELSLRIHDWKNPVTGIQSSLELIHHYYKKEQLSQERFAKHYSRITVALDRLLNGFNDALLVARAEAGKLEPNKEPSDIVTIAQNSINAVEAKATAHTLKLYSIFAEYPLECDANLVQRAIINLLENALKHTPSGEIAIALYRPSEAPGRVCIQVADQGDGIPNQDLQRLFTAFERGNTNATGTGLGLAVVKYCAEAHGGAVRVDSQKDLRLNYPDSQTYKTVFTLCI